MTNRDDLVRRAITGDPKARKSIGPWLEAELWQFFANCFCAHETIAELLQATMLTVWTNAKRRQGDNADEFLNWVLGVGGMTAKSTRTKAARELARQARLPQRVPATPARSPNSVLIEEKRRRLLERCLPQLATPYRDIIRHRLAGGEYREFAAARGITVRQARRRHQTAVKKLTALVDKERVTAGPYRS